MSRQAALKSLFGKAKLRAIPSDFLRETVAPEILNGKHLHEASEAEINLVIAGILNSGNEFKGSSGKGQVAKKHDPVPLTRRPSSYIPDPTAPINEKQMHVINCLYDFLEYDQQRRIIRNKKICGHPWPQNHREGQKIVYSLLAQSAQSLLGTCRGVPRHALTPWESGFLLLNDHAAVKELKVFVDGKNKRGFRRMPKFSLTKLFEILKKYN